MSSVLSICSQSTESVDPSADFLISLFGGQAVIPHKYIFSILKASDVRNADPTLNADRILSKITIIGVLKIQMR